MDSQQLLDQAAEAIANRKASTSGRWYLYWTGTEIICLAQLLPTDTPSRIILELHARDIREGLTHYQWDTITRRVHRIRRIESCHAPHKF